MAEGPGRRGGEEAVRRKEETSPSTTGSGSFDLVLCSYTLSELPGVPPSLAAAALLWEKLAPSGVEKFSYLVVQKRLAGAAASGQNVNVDDDPLGTDVAGLLAESAWHSDEIRKIRRRAKGEDGRESEEEAYHMRRAEEAMALAQEVEDAYITRADDGGGDGWLGLELVDTHTHTTRTGGGGGGGWSAPRSRRVGTWFWTTARRGSGARGAAMTGR